MLHASGKEDHGLGIAENTVSASGTGFGVRLKRKRPINSGAFMKKRYVLSAITEQRFW